MRRKIKTGAILTLALVLIYAVVGYTWITRVKNWKIESSEITEPTMTTVDINSGAIDGTPIGANSASTGAFTTISASNDITLENSEVISNSSDGTVNVTDGTNVLLGVIDGGSAGYLKLYEVTAPETAPSNTCYIYLDASDGDLKAKDDDNEVKTIADFSSD